MRPYRIKTMPVWIEGQTVRGYKAEQFAEAWLRVLGVSQVRQVRNGSSIEAVPNPPNPPNSGSETHSPTDGQSRPLFGDLGYAIWADRAYADGYLTHEELHDQLRLDALAARAHHIALEEVERLEAKYPDLAKGAA